MTLPRLFVETALKLNGQVDLEDRQAHYLVHVLRLSAGDEVLVFDGKSGEWRAEIAQADKGRCRIRLIERTREQSEAQDLDYAFAPLKQARLDYLVQKAVELGVSRLRPVITAHTAVRRLNLNRVRANIVEAAEQCGILTLPKADPPQKLNLFLKECKGRRAVVFCDEASAPASPIAVLERLRGQRITALVGPEGGFSEEERELLRSNCFVHAISLGPRIMRADTAAVAALALINAVLGDWRQ
jgi:16S rRNA (uracil1498-N3)-methyltransferase